MVLTLSHVSGSRCGTVDHFDRESILIGRGEFNDVSLDPFLDPTVSAHHAEIRLEDGLFFLYDRGSLNGTFVNGRPVRRAELRIGDEIGLGRVGPRLRFETKTNGRDSVHPSKPRSAAKANGASAPRTTPKTELERLAELDLPTENRGTPKLAFVALGLAIVMLLVYWFLRTR